MNRVTALACVALAAALPAWVRADLQQVGDGFAYTSKSLHYQKGGEGWKNTSWQDPEKGLTLASDGQSLTYPAGVSHKPTGGRVQSGPGKATRAFGSANSVSLLDQSASRTYYMAFLVRRGEGGAVTLQLSNEMNQPRWIVKIDEQGKAKVTIFGPGAATNADAVPAGQTTFVVSRITTQAGDAKDVVELKLFGPDAAVPSSAPTDWDLKYESNTNVWQQSIEMIVDKGQVEIDELRVGTSWEQIVGTSAE